MTEQTLQLFASSFYGLVLFLMIAEVLREKRPRECSLTTRLISNATLGVLSVFISRGLAPIAGAVVAVALGNYGIGLLNVLSAPAALGFVAGVLLLDLAGYAQHRLFHAMPALWRLHLVHHSDVDLDVSTHFRHHPAEAIVSFAITLMAIVFLGPMAAAILFRAAVQNLCGAVHHANICIPESLDRFIRILLVTPDMHRVHHSSRQFETDSNFGATLSIWDRLFGTYVAQPQDGHLGMGLGLGVFRGSREQWPDAVLMQPFRWRKVRQDLDFGNRSTVT